MVEIQKYGKFKGTGKQKKKHQIILTHTSRNINDYLQSLKYRYNGEYDKIPHYIITREGVILQLLTNSEYSNYFTDPKINQGSITISLENLGWIQKEPLKDYYVNWIGDIYKGVVFERKWRDYYFWQPYTEKQFEMLVQLCKQLFKETSVNSHIIGHNTKITNFQKMEGVLTRSNYSVEFTDVSPAFKFDDFIKKIENE
jgi:N-acetyl-anhydromuramyl-L-alanine amidase AmpD